MEEENDDEFSEKVSKKLSIDDINDDNSLIYLT